MDNKEINENQKFSENHNDNATTKQELKETVESANSNTVSKKEKNVTAILIVIIMILLLVLGIVAGIFISKNSRSEKSKENKSGSSSATQKTENNTDNNKENDNNDDSNGNNSKETDNKDNIEDKNNTEKNTENNNDNQTKNNKEYSQKDLEKMALDYYEAKTGYRPSGVGSQVNSDGTVSIQLYDNMGDHNSTSDWYTINPKTGIGTNILEEKIDLTTKPAIDKTNANNNNSSSNIAAQEIRKCLKDKNWVKNNVMMKTTVFGDALEHEQKLSFIKVVGGNYSPMIVVEAYSDGDLSSQCFIVTYQNGKVVSNPLTEYPLHISHGGMAIDANNAMACQGYMHMGNEASIYYDIKTGSSKTLEKVGKYDDYGDDGFTGNIIYYYGEDSNKITESRYNEILQKYSKYKFVSIGTDLTDANIDEFIK